MILKNKLIMIIINININSQCIKDSCWKVLPKCVSMCGSSGAMWCLEPCDTMQPAVDSNPDEIFPDLLIKYI